MQYFWRYESFNLDFTPAVKLLHIHDTTAWSKVDITMHRFTVVSKADIYSCAKSNIHTHLEFRGSCQMFIGAKICKSLLLKLDPIPNLNPNYVAIR